VKVTFGMVWWSLLPSRWKSVNQCWREMAASPTERSWRVLEFVEVQRVFRLQVSLPRMHLSSSFAKYSDNLYALCIWSFTVILAHCYNIDIIIAWPMYSVVSVSPLILPGALSQHQEPGKRSHHRVLHCLCDIASRGDRVWDHELPERRDCK
jgi:hypothetical protein